MWPQLLMVIPSLLDKIFPDKTAADAAKAKLLELQMNGELQQIMGQLEINKEEAKSSNWFVAGWRPGAGWVCVVGLFYSFLIRPMAEGFGHPMPAIDTDALNALLFAMLGVAGLRTVEKIKQVS